MEKLEDVRRKIDDVDAELTRLLVKRFTLTDEVGRIKREENVGVVQSGRENDILDRIGESVSDEYAYSIKEIYRKIFEQSKERQSKLINE